MASIAPVEMLSVSAWFYWISAVVIEDVGATGAYSFFDILIYEYYKNKN